jgi:hypothetical protein
MISPENTKLLSELKHTNYGKALKEFLDEKYKEINNVAYCTSWDDTLARTKAIKILDDIFSFMKEKQDVSNKTRYD